MLSSTNQQSKAGESATAATPSAKQRLVVEQNYHKQVRKLYTETTRHVQKMHTLQFTSQARAVGSMTRALETLVNRTTELVGYMVGVLLTGGEVSGKSFFANFLSILSQFSIMLGTAAIAASNVLSALFSGNPAALFAGGLALIAIGGVIKAFSDTLKSQGDGGSGSSLSYSASGSSAASSQAVNTNSLDSGESQSSPQIVYYYHFSGGVYDERGLARIAAGAINRHSGRTAPLIARRAVEAV